jgi:CDP-diacylglycerol--glycerol-3-phosphate 3-phosphatidyltransferase
LNWRKVIPWSLVVFRLLLGPAIVLTALWGPARELWLAVMIVAGALSDIFDGVLARRWETATPALRIADSVIDIAFYLAILTAGIDRHWPVIRERLWLVALVLALEVLRISLDFAKFHRMTSYHSYASKFWGFLLIVAAVAMLFSNRGSWLLTVALVWGVLCELEGMAYTIILPEWKHDVKTVARALAIRQRMLERRTAQMSLK